MSDLQQHRELAPFAFCKCSVDAKGRLKAPSDFHDLLRALGAKFFVTSYDDLDIHIYTRSDFRAQCSFLENLATQPELQDDAEDTLFRMRHLGADVTMDGEFRFTLPQELRQRLGLVDLPAAVRMGVDKDHIQVMSEVRYQARINGSGQSSPVDAAKRLVQKGMR